MKEKLILVGLIAAILGGAGCEWPRSIPIWLSIPTNAAPAFAIAVNDSSLVPTNNWRTLVPFEPHIDPTISEADVATIKKLAIAHSWPGRKIEKIVIYPPDNAWVDYLSQPGVHLSTSMFKESGEWKVGSDHEVKHK